MPSGGFCTKTRTFSSDWLARLARLARPGLARCSQLPGTPPIIGFDRTKYEPGLYRRVIYNKGMTVLAVLHARVGTAQLYAILATAAARKVRTTTAFLDVVGQVAGAETRAWLHGELSR